MLEKNRKKDVKVSKIVFQMAFVFVWGDHTNRFISLKNAAEYAATNDF